MTPSTPLLIRNIQTKVLQALKKKVPSTVPLSLLIRALIVQGLTMTDDQLAQIVNAQAQAEATDKIKG